VPAAITFIDGDQGICNTAATDRAAREKSTFPRDSYLLLTGELPTAAELDAWVYQVTHHTIIHENIKEVHRRLPP